MAVSGFAISYLIDGANGQPYTHLRLTPRLLAKLLTESYPGDLCVKQDDPDLSHNPLNITDDPEFIALNPGITQGVDASEAASELMSISSDSDVIEALTSYINADPTARAWLNGTPDQWGDGREPGLQGDPAAGEPVAAALDVRAHRPLPLGSERLPLPQPRPLPPADLGAAAHSRGRQLEHAVRHRQLDHALLADRRHVRSGRSWWRWAARRPAYRFLIGVTPLADTQRYLLQTRPLQTTAGTFVGPRDQSLEAATNLLHPDPTTGPGPSRTRRSRAPPGRRPTPGRWSSTPRCPRAGSPRRPPATSPRGSASPATSGQTPGLGVGRHPARLPPDDGCLRPRRHGGVHAAAADDVQAQNGEIPGVASATGDPPGSSPGSSSLQADGALTTASKLFNASMIPVLLSIEGRTLRINLDSVGGVIAAIILGILGFAAVAGAGIIVGRRRGIW